MALGHILFGVLGPLWVLGSEAGRSSESAMSAFYVLGPILVNGVVSVPLGVVLWRGFKPARLVVLVYGFLWVTWAIPLFPFVLPVIALRNNRCRLSH